MAKQRRLEPTVLHVQIDAIALDASQPRRASDARRERTLARAIRDTGTLEPLLVCERQGGFTLLCGERRFLAAKRAGLQNVPVVLREATAAEELMEGLVSDVQSDELDPIDEARTLQTLIEDFDLTHADVARRVSRSRSHVTNGLRLLTLPAPVQELVRAGQLTTGHARGVLRLKQPDAQLKMAQRIVNEALSVRRVEKDTPATRATRPVQRVVRAVRKGPPAARFMSRELQHLAKAIETRIGRDVGIFWNGSGGELTIPFESKDQLRAFLASLLRS
jgi:ParB family chromosome partitioning protein